jgi:hypothetical protein
MAEHYFWLGASADADPALVASDQAASRLAPEGFDPLRDCDHRIISITRCDKCNTAFCNGCLAPGPLVSGYCRECWGS